MVVVELGQSKKLCGRMDMCGHVCQMSEGTSGAQHLGGGGVCQVPPQEVFDGVSGDHMAVQTTELAVGYGGHGQSTPLGPRGPKILIP